MYDLLKLFQMGRSHMVALVQPYEADIQDVLDELAPERPTSSTSSSSAPSRASSIDLDRQRMVAMENVAVRASRAASVAGGSDVMPAVQARDHTELGQVHSCSTVACTLGSTVLVLLQGLLPIVEVTECNNILVV